MRNSKIEWTSHTFNPWFGCVKVSDACDNCYAEALAKRFGKANLWQGDIERTSPRNWSQVLHWDAAARAEQQRWVATHGVGPRPHRPRVFCASIADVFDNRVPEAWRADLWALIAQTPNLDWLLLTKRWPNILKMLPGAHVEQLLGRDAPWAGGWDNVWLGITAEHQKAFDHGWPFLQAVPARVRFISYGPALGQVDMGNSVYGPDWVVAEGESGPAARPSEPNWFRHMRDQCKASDIPFLFKQWGEWFPSDQRDGSRIDTSPVPGFFRMGKAKSGRLLDGVLHDAFPDSRTWIRPPQAK